MKNYVFFLGCFLSLGMMSCTSYKVPSTVSKKPTSDYSKGKPVVKVPVTKPVVDDEDDYDYEEEVDNKNEKAVVKTIIKEAKGYKGTPYKFGGTNKRGIDCSALVQNCFSEAGVEVPRNSQKQAETGKKVSKSKAQLGDLIFFATGRKGVVSHVGIISSVNDDEIKFIHASTSKGVMESSLNEDYWNKRTLRINRVLD